MRDRNRYEHEDRAVLIELMARAWRESAAVLWPNFIDPGDENLTRRMRGLYLQHEAPQNAADRAALAILQPGPGECAFCGADLPPGERRACRGCAADDGDPVTDEDRAAMEACPTCDGEPFVVDRSALDGGASSWTCPPPPDGCGGTGRRGGK